jgi:hypothetical protein
LRSDISVPLTEIDGVNQCLADDIDTRSLVRRRISRKQAEDAKATLDNKGTEHEATKSLLDIVKSEHEITKIELTSTKEDTSGGAESTQARLQGRAAPSKLQPL